MPVPQDAVNRAVRSCSKTAELALAVAQKADTLAATTADSLATLTTTVNDLPTILTALDEVGTTRGMILYRGADVWAALAPGTAGQVLVSGGAGADPYWATP